MIDLLKNNRYLIARRFTQIGIITLFITSFRLDWKIGGVEILEGNLSASKFIGLIPLSDPFAVLQILFTGNSLIFDVLLGAAIVMVFYVLIGGRVFCSWVCPVNLITDSAQRIRSTIRPPQVVKIHRHARYYLLALALLLSALSGVAAFEWVSPISMLHRELIYGMNFGWAAVAAIFTYDLFIQKQAWCGHLCPLGAFYSILGKISLLRIRFDKEACTKCGDCHRVCPEPQVLNLNVIFREGMVYSGNCTNCGRCITKCPEDCFQFSIRKKKN